MSDYTNVFLFLVPAIPVILLLLAVATYLFGEWRNRSAEKQSEPVDHVALYFEGIKKNILRNIEKDLYAPEEPKMMGLSEQVRELPVSTLDIGKMAEDHENALFKAMEDDQERAKLALKVKPKKRRVVKKKKSVAKRGKRARKGKKA